MALTYDNSKSMFRNAIDALIQMANATLGLGIFSGDLTLQNGETISNATDGQIKLTASNIKYLLGTSGGLKLMASEATANITAAASVTIQVNVPTGARRVGCQLRVDSALTTGETWDAHWHDGSQLDQIADTAAVAKNTKVTKFSDANAATALTDAETDIVITKHGGGSFTAAGVIRAIAYYEVFEAMADAA